MDFTESFEEYVSADDEVLSCEVLTVDKICEVTEDEEMSEAEEEAVETPSFSNAVKRFETFCCFIKSVEDVPEEVFKSLRQLGCYQLKIAIKKQKQRTSTDFFCKTNSSNV